MSAHATHAADLTAESDEALRAADLWLQNSLRVSTKCKFWGLGTVLHSQEAAAASAAEASTTLAAVRACSSDIQPDTYAAAAAAALANAAEPMPGVSVALAAAASVFSVQDDIEGDEEGSAGAVTVGPGVPSVATAELERLWWGQTGNALVERQQLRSQNRRRERNNRVLWFLE